MGKSRNKEISAALYRRIAPLLPTVKPSSKGGRPRLSDELTLNGILFVLRAGTPWEHLSQELGFGSGMTCWRRLFALSNLWMARHKLLDSQGQVSVQQA